MTVLRYFMSPLMFVWITFVSYFALLGFLEFATPNIYQDIFWLGVIAFAFSAVLLRPNIRRSTISRKVANQLILGATLSLIPVSIYAFVITGGALTALLDDRFAIPGYGLVFAVFFTASVVGTAIFAVTGSGFLKCLFALNVVFAGFIFGGKGFIFPVFWGVVLSYHLGFIKFKLPKFILLAFFMSAGAFLAVISRVESASDALLLIGVRILFQADSVSWISQMSLSDIQGFPITAGTFVLDLFTRFVGIRVNPLPVGSEMANLVVGDDSGGGPNPTLPVLAYLVNQGNFALAVSFVIVTVFFLWLLIRVCRTLSASNGPWSIILATLMFFVPFAVIDMVLLLQLGFCLILIGFLSSIVGVLGRLTWQTAIPIGGSGVVKRASVANR